MMKDKFKILVINPNENSTKMAVYENENLLLEKNILHNSDELIQCNHIHQQLPIRKKVLCHFMQEAAISSPDLDCIVGRGGELNPILGGTYLVDKVMCEELQQTKKGHVYNLGALLAYEIAEEIGVPSFIVDPFIVDEMNPVAKISGFPGIERESNFHALNQKAIARKAACKYGKSYQKCNFIIAHLDRSISIGVHEQGQVIDVNNCWDGDGPFSMDMAGSIPMCSLIEMYFHSGLTHEHISKNLVSQGGLVSYLGTNDLVEVEKLISEKNEKANMVFEAMAYQIAKEISSYATVLKGKIDSIIFTGYLANSNILIDWITQRIKFLAPILLFPDEIEMEALALGALRVLKKEEDYKIYSSYKKKTDYLLAK